MKNSFLIVFLLLNALTCMAQQVFFYEIETSSSLKVPVNTLYIDYEIAGVNFRDTLDLKVGFSKLKKVLPQPTDASLSVDNDKILPLSVFLGNNTLQITIEEAAILVGKDKLQEDSKYLPKTTGSDLVIFPFMEN